MLEPAYLLMVCEGRHWIAAQWPPAGRVLTREQAEGWAVQMQDAPRFLMAYTPDLHHLAEGEPLALGPGETLWDYGEPLELDLRAVLRAAAATQRAETVPAPADGSVAVSLATVRRLAIAWFGPADVHRIDLAFDRLLFDAGGRRQDGEPAVYRVPHSILAPG